MTDSQLTNCKVACLFTDHQASEFSIRSTSAFGYCNKNISKRFFDPRVKMNQSRNTGLKIKPELTNGKKYSFTPITKLRNQSTYRLVHFDLSMKLNRRKFFDSRVRMNQSKNMSSTTILQVSTDKVVLLYTDHQASERKTQQD